MMSAENKQIYIVSVRTHLLLQEKFLRHLRMLSMGYEINIDQIFARFVKKIGNSFQMIKLLWCFSSSSTSRRIWHPGLNFFGWESNSWDMYELQQKCRNTSGSLQIRVRSLVPFEIIVQQSMSQNVV